jgi:HEAT repeat protein
LVRLLDIPGNPQQTQRIRANVIMGLGEFGAQAKPAVPSLLRLLNDADEGIRGQVTNALLTIDPEAAARAGAK